MKSPLAQSDAPGAKTPQNCPWWVRFRPDQGQKPHKTAGALQNFRLSFTILKKVFKKIDRL
jgi:hypothetical protein